jgi:parallel beta-helix repeat protein
VTVKNNDLKQYGTVGGGLGGITLEGTGVSLNQVLNNHVEANKEVGILLDGSSDNTVSSNDVKGKPQNPLGLISK